MPQHLLSLEMTSLTPPDKTKIQRNHQNSYMIWAGLLNDLKETSCNGGGDN